MKCELYTDGSHFPGTKISGWAYYLKMSISIISESGFVESRDVNYAELMAVVYALEFLEEGCTVDVYTDSLFVINAQTRQWTYSKQIGPAQVRFRECLKKHIVTFIFVPSGQGKRPKEHSIVHHMAREACKPQTDSSQSGESIPQESTPA